MIALKFNVYKKNLIENANSIFETFSLIDDNNLFVFSIFYFLYFLIEFSFNRYTSKLFIMKFEIQKNNKNR